MAVALASAAGNTEDINGSGGDIVLAAPASIASGDTRIHFLWQVAGGSPPNIGTGYTDIGSDYNVGDDNGIRAVFRVATGSEGNGTHTTPGADVVSTGYALRATGGHGTTPINASAVGHTAAGTSPRTLPTVTTTVNNCLIVYYVIITDGTVTPTMSGVGSVYDTHITNGTLDIAAIYSETLATAGTSTARTVSWTGGGSKTVAYAVVAIAPADTGITGTAAITLAPFVSAASGSVIETGSAAITLDPFTSSASGTVTNPSITGTASPTLGAFTSSASGLVFNGQYPTTVSTNGRFIEDQHGDPWPVLGDANIVIHTVPHLTVDEVATGKSVESYLDELVAHGFNAFWCKLVYASSGGIVYEDVDGNEPFTGTIFQTSLNAPYWDNWETIVTMAAERNITLFLFPTWAGFDDTEGDRVEMEAASGAQMEDYGEAIGARFAKYPNIIWMNGGDRPAPSATTVSRWGSVATGIQAAGDTHLWGLQGTRGVLQSTYISTNSMGAQPFDLNTMYQDEADPTGDAATAYSEDIGPVIAYEMVYENENSITFNRLRLQYWGTFCSGGVGHVFGNRPRWHMDLFGAFAVAGVSYLETWDDTDGNDDRGTDDFAVFNDFVATLAGDWATMAPDTTDTFLTSGEGTGTTRASARFNPTGTTNLAVAYRPHGGSTSLTFDLTEFTAVDAVRIRKFDPIDGSYTTVGDFATTGSQAVGSFGTNSGGDGDWVLVFEAVPNIQLPYWGIRIR